MKIYLRDRNPFIAQCWRTCFHDVPDVDVSAGDIFEIEADALVSPANSFGFMNGGIDLIYTKRFGEQLQERLQQDLVRYHHGELLVGEALIIPIGVQDKYKYLISAPTMRVPMNIWGTVNAYLAFRAILIAATEYLVDRGPVIGREYVSESPIKSILCPGLGTAIGHLDPMACAYQMRVAYDVVIGKKPLQFDDIANSYTHHSGLRRGVDTPYPTEVIERSEVSMPLTLEETNVNRD